MVCGGKPLKGERVADEAFPKVCWHLVAGPALSGQAGRVREERKGKSREGRRSKREMHPRAGRTRGDAKRWGGEDRERGRRKRRGN